MVPVCYIQTEAIGGWKIAHEVEGEGAMFFRFHHKSRLQGGASVTVSTCTSL